MRKFTYQERLKMLMAAFELCPECQAEFTRFAEVPGRDAIEFMKDMLWNLWQNWPHGAGCPLPEVPAVRQADAPGPLQTSSAPAQVAGIEKAAGTAENVTGYEVDQGAGSLA